MTNTFDLPQFSELDAGKLQSLITDSIAKANELLDVFAQDVATSPEQALADIERLELLNNVLGKHWAVLSNLNSTVSTDDIRAAHHAVLPLLSEYGTRQGQHKNLFARYELVQNDSTFFESLGMARQRAVELAIQDFKMAGVALPEAEQQRFAEISKKLSSLNAKFSDNVLDSTQSFKRVLTKEEIDGVTETGLHMLASAGTAYEKANEDTDFSNQKVNGQLYVATLDIPIYITLMTYSTARLLREDLYKAFCTRASDLSNDGEFNNADTMVEILNLRQEQAKILDFANYAENSVAVKMADSPKQVLDFLYDLAKRATPAAQKDVEELEAEAKLLGLDELQPWDLSFVSEKIKNKKYNLSQEAMRPYFPVNKVIDGLFAIVEKLYGLQIAKVEADVWHDDVTFYEVSENGKKIGAFWFDLYARTGKRGGAWMAGYQNKMVNEKAKLNQLPVCFMICNFTPPVELEDGTTQQALLTHDEVVTLFHEFGHGLHHLLTEVTVEAVAGINGVEWDAVELPSQFMEYWSWEKEGIALISEHLATGEALPQEMLEAMLAAKNFQSGMQTLRQIEFSVFDLLIHSQDLASESAIQDVLDGVRKEVAISTPPSYNKFQNGFSHIFAGGYAAGYYSYKWAEVLAADAFDRFETDGIFNTQTGSEFRSNILAMGGSQKAATNFANFRKRETSIDALLRHCGLN